MRPHPQRLLEQIGDCSARCWLMPGPSPGDSRFNQAWAWAQSRLTVRGDVASAAAVTEVQPCRVSSAGDPFRWARGGCPGALYSAGTGHGTLAGGDAVLDRPEYERWRESAAGARRAAEVQAASDLHNWACFLAEQAAQLAAKSLLHGTGAGAWGHDLVALGERLREAAGEELPDAVAAALRRLSRHYIPPRYPDAHPGGSPMAYYGTEDSADAIADADRVIAHVDGLWERLLAAEAAISAETKQDDGG